MLSLINQVLQHQTTTTQSLEEGDTAGDRVSLGLDLQVSDIWKQRQITQNGQLRRRMGKSNFKWQSPSSLCASFYNIKYHGEVLVYRMSQP